MAKINELKHRLCDFKKFSEDRYSFTEKTHRVYVGSAIQYLKDNFAIEFKDLESATTEQDCRTILEKIGEAVASCLSFDKLFAIRKTSDSWRQVRISLTHLFNYFGLVHAAEKIASVKNPSSVLSRKKSPLAKRRKKSISKKDLRRLIDDRIAANDAESWTMLVIMFELGVRPCELKGITIIGAIKENGCLDVFVKGSKNTVIGKKNKSKQRGMSRTIENVPYSAEFVEAVRHWSDLGKGGAFEKEINSARARIVRMGKKLLKDDGKTFCPYTLRYFMGSRLKHKHRFDVNGCIKTSAQLGQLSARSSSRYGNAGTGKKFKDCSTTATPSDESVKLVRDNRSQIARKKSIDDAVEKDTLRKFDQLNRNDKLSHDERQEKIKKMFDASHKARTEAGNGGPRR